MTNSHHGGFLSVMIMVGICQWQNPTIDKDDEELQLCNQSTQFNWSQVYFQLFNHLTQFNWSQVYFAINSSVWVNLGRKYVCFTGESSCYVVVFLYDCMPHCITVPILVQHNGATLARLRHWLQCIIAMCYYDQVTVNIIYTCLWYCMYWSTNIEHLCIQTALLH